MKIYCPECGRPNSYASKKPNFCQNCGNKLGNQSDICRREAKSSDLDPEEDEHTEIPLIDGLDVEITPHHNQGVTLGEIVSAAEAPEEEPLRQTPTPKKRLSKKAREAADKKFLQDWQKEAGTMRRPPKNE